MAQSDGPHPLRDPLAFLVGGGEMGKLIRSMDWSKTQLGPVESWPQSLRTTVSLCLASNFPISLAWGPKHTQIYNDGYWPICGGKHPHSIGQDFSECWASAWPAIGEAFERALAGETSFLENQRMFLDRNGYLEETFFTFSFSPIQDELGGVRRAVPPRHRDDGEHPGRAEDSSVAGHRRPFGQGLGGRGGPRPDCPILLDADVTRMSQVFSNLLNNAAKYTERGGEIALVAERQGSDVVVTVSDNGVGIPQEMLPGVFAMFTQVDQSLERSQGGLGIGLSLVKTLVEMHGGSIEARSEGHGRGSQFAVRLPVVVPAPTPRVAPESDASPVGPVGTFRILVVDDNIDSARTLARLLKLMGERDTHGARRVRGGRGGRGVPPRGHAAGHRHAGDERLRGGSNDPGTSLGPGRHDHRPDRVGPGG